MKKEIIDNLFIAFAVLTIITIDVMISFSIFGLYAGTIVAINNLLLLPRFLVATFDNNVRNKKESFTYGVEYLIIIDLAIIDVYSMKYLIQILLVTSLIIITLVLYWLHVDSEAKDEMRVGG